MKPEPIFAAVESLRTEASTVVLMTPQGRRFAQSIAHTFSAKEHLIIVCGHYEGVDHRVIEHLIDAEISIGDYVLTNGAIAAVVFVDAIVRLLPGVLGDEQSAVDDSFTGGLLEAPQYTRPAEFRGWKVPDILLSGHHAEIAAWRRREAERRTRENRPDLLPQEQVRERHIIQPTPCYRVKWRIFIRQPVTTSAAAVPSLIDFCCYRRLREPAFGG